MLQRSPSAALLVEFSQSSLAAKLYLSTECNSSQEGVEVPPEEEEVPIEEEVDLGLLESNEPEDLSYAAMFAHTLNLGKDSMQTPQKMKESLQWGSAASADPIVQPHSIGQVVQQYAPLLDSSEMPAILP